MRKIEIRAVCLVLKIPAGNGIGNAAAVIDPHRFIAIIVQITDLVIDTPAQRKQLIFVRKLIQTRPPFKHRRKMRAFRQDQQIGNNDINPFLQA